MKPIPIFQIVRLDDTRVVIRHYNEAADKFERVCSAQDDVHLSLPRDYALLRDRLLITPDGRICYSHKGKLYYPGKVSDLVTVLSATSGEIQMLDVSYMNMIQMPFNYLFINQKGEWFDEVISYEKTNEGLKLQTAQGCVRYTLRTRDYEDPDEGPVSFTELYRG